MTRYATANAWRTVEGEHPTQTDALVVGLGLAGLAVVSALERRGRTFAAMHTELPHAGSPVAAGLMLPITGRRWVLRPHYATLLAAARLCVGAVVSWGRGQWACQWVGGSAPATGRRCRRRGPCT